MKYETKCKIISALLANLVDGDAGYGHTVEMIHEVLDA